MVPIINDIREKNAFNLVVLSQVMAWKTSVLPKKAELNPLLYRIGTLVTIFHFAVSFGQKEWTQRRAIQLRTLKSLTRLVIKTFCSGLQPKNSSANPKGQIGRRDYPKIVAGSLYSKFEGCWIWREPCNIAQWWSSKERHLQWLGQLFDFLG